MGLFDKLKGKKETVDWSNAYTAVPKFYGKPDGTLFGAIALTERTETSTTKDTIIGDADYFTALNDVEKYALDSKKDSVLVKGLSLSELESLRG